MYQGTTVGDMLVWDGTQWIVLAVNTTATRKFVKSVNTTTALDTLVAGDLPSHVHPTYGASVINRLAGVTPTQAEWDTAPTDLSRATDGDWATATGVAEAVSVAEYSHSAGYFKFNLGAIYNVTLRAKVILGILTNSEDVGLNIYASEDDATYRLLVDPSSLHTWITHDSDTTLFVGPFFLRGRYIKIYVANNDSAAHTIRLGLTEIQAIDFGV